MSETRKFKSLRDCLLKSTVINFDRIFIENDQIESKVTKKGIRLSPHLFEDIQDKSVEISWKISHNSLKACLSRREALRWENINLAKVSLEETDLLNIAESNFPIKQMAFETHCVTDAMMDVLETFASTIEVLDIRFDEKVYYNCNPTRMLTKCEGKKFQKLKVLSLDLESVPHELLCRLDLPSCSDSLRQLNLLLPIMRDVSYYENFIASIKVLRSLESLAVVLRGNWEAITILDSIKHLTNLRMLSISTFDNPPPPEMRLVEILPKLEYLTLPSIWMSMELNSLNEKMLKYAGIDYYMEDAPENVKILAFELGLTYAFQSYIDYLESSSFEILARKYKPLIFTDLATLIYRYPLCSPLKPPSVRMNQLKSIEKIILTYLEWDVNPLQNTLLIMKKHENDWSLDFIIKLSNYLISSQMCEKGIRTNEILFKFLIVLEPIQKYMTHYVAMNPNSSVSILYSKHGIISKKNKWQLINTYYENDIKLWK